MKILLFGGTTEGRVLAQKLAARGAQITVSVATELGREAMPDAAGIAVRVGRLDAAQMQPLLQNAALCIDATHPYAVEASANIKAACAKAGVPLRRLLRDESTAQAAVRVHSCREAAAFLAGQQGNILLATGAKELSAFAQLEKARLFARVLPTHEGIAACEAMGLGHANILALQGPFTMALNTAMLVQYRIAWLVTKDGGTAGGFAEKQEAAAAAAARLVLICRPPEQGETLEQIYQSIRGKLE